MTKVTITNDVEFCCAVCGAELIANCGVNVNTGRTWIDVKPCRTCLNDSKKLGRAEGLAEAKDG